MAQVTIRKGSGPEIIVNETKPGLFGELGYTYISGGPTTTTQPTPQPNQPPPTSPSPKTPKAGEPGFIGPVRPTAPSSGEPGFIGPVRPPNTPSAAPTNQNVNEATLQAVMSANGISRADALRAFQITQQQRVTLPVALQQVKSGGGASTTTPLATTDPFAQQKTEATDQFNADAEKVFNSLAGKEIDTRNSSKILADIQAKLQAAPPEQVNLLELFNQKRVELGLDVLETELSDIDSEIERIETEAFVAADVAEEGQVSTRAIGREQTQIGREAERSIALLQIERSAVARVMNNKLGTLQMTMEITQQDFSNASTLYNQEYNRAFQLLQLFNTETNRVRDDARANLNTIINLAQDAGKTLNDFTPEMRFKIEEMEVQAGLPSGTMVTFLVAKPNTKILSTTTGTNAAGEQVVTFIYQDPVTGKPGVIETVKTSGVKSRTEADKGQDEIAKVEGIFEESKGSDGFVSPETYAKERRNSSITPSQFDQRFAPTYTNPKDRAGLGITASEAGVTDEKFLTKEYFKGLFTDDQLNDAAEKAGFRKGLFGFQKGDQEAYLNSIMEGVERERKAGLTDQQILKKFPKAK